MPIPTPNKGESQADYVSRFMGNDAMQEYPQKQRLAIAFSTWRRHKKSKKDAVVETGHDWLVRQTREFVIKSVNTKKRVVTGVVYEPNVIDTHGEMMLPEDVELLAHRFMSEKLCDSIDVLHDNALIDACAVESYIAKDNDPDYATGSWVLSVKFAEEEDAWDRVEVGELNGYSIEMMVKKVPAIAEIEVMPSVLGYTEISDGHQHIFYARIGDDGRVIGGTTSEEADGSGEPHSHQITFGTATDEDSGHSHRFFLP